MNRSWVRFPQAAPIRPPGTGWAFLYALTGRAALCALGRRPAREIATREPDGSEWSISRPALALPPPTGTAARPSGVLHTSGAGSLTCGSARRLEARPGPATAHRHHGQAVQSPPVSPASQYLPHRQRWGFCSIRRWLAACRRHVAPLMTLFPRLVAEPCDYADCDGRRVAPSCSCRCQGPNAGPQPYEATVASGKIG